MKEDTSDKIGFWNSIYSAFVSVWEIYFKPENRIISERAKRILNNPEDKKAYNDALSKLEKEPQQTITLSDKTTMTIVSGAHFN